MQNVQPHCIYPSRISLHLRRSPGDSGVWGLKGTSTYPSSCQQMYIFKIIRWNEEKVYSFSNCQIKDDSQGPPDWLSWLTGLMSWSQRPEIKSHAQQGICFSLFFNPSLCSCAQINKTLEGGKKRQWFSRLAYSFLTIGMGNIDEDFQTEINLWANSKDNPESSSHLL